MTKFKTSKFTSVIVVAAVIAAAAGFYYIHTKYPAVPSYTATVQNTTTTASPTPTGTPGGNSQPATLNLPIPFTSQAPTANWDLVHNEDCEEAASVMANAYLTGNTAVVLPAAQVESEMTTLNNWEDSNLGYHLDTTAEETAQMIQAVYGLRASVQNGYTLQNIKDQLNMQHVVILPVNGQIIGNPNYTAPGPIYHMLVIRGYSGSTLITDDSGTRRGQNYPYAFQTLYNAGADWDHGTNTIDQTKKVMITVWK
jgi:hypothetical protein